MLLAGDEFGRSQGGNNNAYCQDNDISWVQWEQSGKRGDELRAFVRRLTTLRQRLPVLRRGRFLTGAWNESLKVKDATWLTPGGTEMDTSNWSDGNMRSFALLLEGRAQPSGVLRAGEEATVLLIFNAWHDAVEFKLPECPSAHSWIQLVDTTANQGDDAPRFAPNATHLVTGPSMSVFIADSAEEGDQFVRDLTEALSVAGSQ